MGRSKQLDAFINDTTPVTSSSSRGVSSTPSPEPRRRALSEQLTGDLLATLRRLVASEFIGSPDAKRNAVELVDELRARLDDFQTVGHAAGHAADAPVEHPPKPPERLFLLVCGHDEAIDLTCIQADRRPGAFACDEVYEYVRTKCYRDTPGSTK